MHDLWLLCSNRLVNQIFVHGVKLPLQIIYFFLLGVKFLSLHENAPVLILNLLEFHLRLIIDQLELVLVLLVDLLLDGDDVLVIQLVALWRRRLLVRFHSG